MRPHVVIVEDEPDLLELVRYNFQKEGFEVTGFERGDQAIEFLRRKPADLVLLDIMLPGEDGLEICRRMRADGALAGIPLIFLTAKGEEVDRVVGLELGADDYVVKPFSIRELIARARAVLRRRLREEEKSGLISTGAVEINPSTQDVSVRGRPIRLSALEFKLLHFLASHPRRIYSRERLLDQIWGADRSVTPRTVDVHIRRLREKVEQHPDQPDYIQTVRGSGYRFCADSQNEPQP